jgi:hypothetical protein
MSEKKLVVEHLKLQYDGLFDATGLYQYIDDWLREKGFDKREVRNREHVTPEGKFVELELQPWKKITTYAQHIIRMEIRLTKLKEVEIEKEKHKIRLNKGKVAITFDGYLVTDYEHRWEQRPLYFFLRTIFDKFIYRSYTAQYEALLVETVNQLHSGIKAYLNMYKHTAY